LPDFESLSGGGITAGAGGAAGNAGSAGSAGSAGNAGNAGSSGSAGTGGTAGTGGSAGNAGTPGILPDGGIVNMIPNPDFEGSTNAWTQIGNCALQIVTAPAAQSGSRSLQISNRVAEWEGPGFPVVNLLRDGVTYEFGLWTKIAEGEIPLQLTYKRRCEGDPDLGAFVPVAAAITANDEWQFISGTVTGPSCEPIESVLFIEVPYVSRTDPNAKVTFYIDNTYLIPTDP
jgi:carbohydrate binding protein with CBM4/9 domain